VSPARGTLAVLLQAMLQAPAAADDIDIYRGAGVGHGEHCGEAAGAHSMVTAVGPTAAASASGEPADLYFAMFQAGTGPGWSGNVKKLKLIQYLAPDTNAVPSAPVVAQAPLTDPPREALDIDGRIRADALTFWTDPQGRDVRAFDPGRGEVAGRDGRSVRRGGAGQQIPGYLGGNVGAANHEPGARQVFTENPAPPGGLLALDVATPALPALRPYLDPGGSMDEAELRRLIGWIRGRDAFDADDDGNTAEPRNWLMGDLLHSRPLPVSYGARPGTLYRADNPDQRLLLGTNDGLLRMLRNTRDDARGSESGEESWAFVPLELLHVQAVLAGRVAPGLQPHIYGMDGEAVAHSIDRDRDGNIETGDGDRVWAYIGQRRGGRALYAFDVSDPEHPVLKWKITPDTPGFDQLALTFSTPRVAQLDYDNGVARSVLLFGGGYHGGWQDDVALGKDAGGGPDTIGNAVYVVDAESGELVWRAVGPGLAAVPANGERHYFHAAMEHSIAAPLTVVDSDDNGVADRVYVGDTGGNLLRIELTEYRHREPGSEPTAAANWYVHTLAQLGGEGVADRRFFHAPDYVRARDDSGDYLGVVITSGNRAAPLEVQTEDFAYLVKDRATLPYRRMGAAPLPPAVSHDALVDVTVLCLRGDEVPCQAADLRQGWRLRLGQPGEKGLSSPLVRNGIVYFTSFLPAADACPIPRGDSRSYAVALADGSAPPVPGAILQRPVRYQMLGPGMAGDILPLPGPLLITGQGDGGGQLRKVPGPRLWRAYWSEQGVDAF
jgi:type IV pilus assembly protein PilY1